MNIYKDPFRLYFPSGIFFGLLGVMSWISFFLNKTDYPGLYHADLMILGFYTHVAMGFLMTAIPRFTGTQSASRFEIGFGVFFIFIFLIVASRMFLLATFLPVIFLLEILFLVSYFARRFVSRKSNPPPTFMFLFAGLVCALVGGILLSLQLFHVISADVNARWLIYYGWTMGPMLGIGGMLVPRIIGYLDQPVQPVEHTKIITLKKNYVVMGVLSLIFLLAQMGYAFTNEEHCLYLRQAVVTVVLLFYFKIYLLPPNRGYLVKGLWLSSWFLLLGSWLSVLDAAHRIHDIHIYFIASISLMIGCIATRVVVAHGNYPITDETDSKWLLGLIVFLILAALTRTLAPWTQSYFMHLAIASFLWVVAYLLWLIKYLPKVFLFGKKDQQSNC